MAGSSLAMPRELVNLKQSRGPHAASDAHCDDRVPGSAPLAFDQDVAGHARTAHAERMSDRDRAAVDIEPVHWNAEPVAAIEHLAGERLVQLPQVDVVHAQAGALQQLRHGKHRADAHLVRLAAGDGKTTERAERLE